MLRCGTARTGSHRPCEKIVKITGLPLLREVTDDGAHVSEVEEGALRKQ